jgi:sirohydrochlorin ferrochelatase
VNLIIVGHGTERHKGSGEAVRDHATRLQVQGVYGEVHYCYIDEAPFDTEVLQKVSRPNVVVVPFLVSDGRHSRVDIPAHMGFLNEGDPRGNSMKHLSPSIEQLWYCPAIGTGPWMDAVVWARLQELELDLCKHLKVNC